MYNAIQRYNNFLIYYYKNRTDKEIPTLREWTLTTLKEQNYVKIFLQVHECLTSISATCALPASRSLCKFFKSLLNPRPSHFPNSSRRPLYLVDSADTLGLW